MTDGTVYVGLIRKELIEMKLIPRSKISLCQKECVVRYVVCSYTGRIVKAKVYLCT